MAKHTNIFFLNSGFGGSVHAAKHCENGSIVAIKTVRRSESNQAAIERESKCAQMLTHDGIIKTLEINETDSTVQYVQEYAECGDLFDYIQTYGCFKSEIAIKSLFSQIVAAVTYMHDRGFCHRDIKPENVVLTMPGGNDELVAKLIDFGLAEDNVYVQGRAGTELYSAPEVATVHQGEFIDGFAADAWSLGILLVFLLSGRPPWSVASAQEDSEFAAFLQRYRDGKPGAVFSQSMKSLGLTSDLAALLDGLLTPDPSYRLSLDQIPLLLEKPWTDQKPDTESMYMYRMPSAGDSGVSWGDLDDEEVDFSSMPLPTFEPITNSQPIPKKTDSGMSYY